MTSHSQLQAAQQDIHRVSAQIDKAERELAKARADNDSKEVDYLRNSLVELRRQLSSLCEEKNILLRAQAPGQHCLPCQSSFKLHTSCAGSLPTVCCPLTVKKHTPAGGDRTHYQSTGQGPTLSTSVDTQLDSIFTQYLRRINAAS